MLTSASEIGRNPSSGEACTKATSSSAVSRPSRKPSKMLPIPSIPNVESPRRAGLDARGADDLHPCEIAYRISFC